MCIIVREQTTCACIGWGGEDLPLSFSFALAPEGDAAPPRLGQGWTRESYDMSFGAVLTEGVFSVWGRVRDAAGRATVQAAGAVNATAFVPEAAGVSANGTAAQWPSSGGGEGEDVLAAIEYTLEKMRGVGQHAAMAQLASGKMPLPPQAKRRWMAMIPTFFLADVSLLSSRAFTGIAAATAAPDWEEAASVISGLPPKGALSRHPIDGVFACALVPCSSRPSALHVHDSLKHPRGAARPHRRGRRASGS